MQLTNLLEVSKRQDPVVWHSLGAASLAEAILKHPLITVQIAGAVRSTQENNNG